MIGLTHSHPATGASIFAQPLTESIVVKTSNFSLDIDPPLRASLDRLKGGQPRAVTC
jgi:hypothetical protein